MLVATELLTCIEGPMWNLIRGLGLAYSFTMYGDADEGLCYFSLSRSPALAKVCRCLSVSLSLCLSVSLSVCLCLSVGGWVGW